MLLLLCLIRRSIRGPCLISHAAECVWYALVSSSNFPAGSQSILRPTYIMLLVKICLLLFIVVLVVAPVCSRHIIYEIERAGGLAKAVKPTRHICVRPTAPTYQDLRLIYGCHHLHTYIRRSGVRASGPGCCCCISLLHAPEIVFLSHARQPAAGGHHHFPLSSSSSQQPSSSPFPFIYRRALGRLQFLCAVPQLHHAAPSSYLSLAVPGGAPLLPRRRDHADWLTGVALPS